MSLIFMQFSVKILPNKRLLPQIQGLAPPRPRLGNPGSVTVLLIKFDSFIVFFCVKKNAQDYIQLYSKLCSWGKKDEAKHVEKGNW